MTHWTHDQLQAIEAQRRGLVSAPPYRIYDITPMGKPRQTQRDRWAKRPAVLRYRAFCDEVRLRGVDLPQGGAHVTFVLPMPASWTKRKRAEMDGQSHQQKPDWDNLAKALCDAIYDDDSGIHDIRVSKIWGETGQIIVRRAA